MNTLLLRFAGPMQAWGTQSRFSERDTGQEPSKSGVIGILCAALGMTRETTVAPLPGGGGVSLDTLANLRMAVRVEREGIIERDFQTAGGGEHRQAKEGYGVVKASGNVSDDPVVSIRYYIADADFLVGLGSEDVTLLQTLYAALRRPHWSLFLGRKAFAPGMPIWVPDSPAHYGPPLRIGKPDDVLRTQPWCANQHNGQPPEYLRLVTETDAANGARRQDVPVSFAIAERTYRVRYVATGAVKHADLPTAGPVANRFAASTREGSDVSLMPAL